MSRSWAPLRWVGSASASCRTPRPGSGSRSSSPPGFSSRSSGRRAGLEHGRSRLGPGPLDRAEAIRDKGAGALAEAGMSERYRAADLEAFARDLFTAAGLDAEKA